MKLETGSDGLPVRHLEIHSFRKPLLLRYYLNPFTLIVSKRFRRLCYIDGFSGPGRLRFAIDRENYEIDGSPLVALKARPGFTDYFFCDSSKKCRDALEIRRDKIAIGRNVDILPAQDFNVCLPSILSTIPWDCHIFAFLDPDGLELNWLTVAEIGRRRYRELLINFSNGVYRCATTAKKNPKHHQRVNAFMGSDDKWWNYSSEQMLETYKNNLKALGTGFRHVLDLPVRNSLGTTVYNLLFATDNDTAVKILRDRVRELWGLNTDQLRTMFLREQGEEIPDLLQYTGTSIKRGGPDPHQVSLSSFVRKE